jgi:hypothetical protein
MEPQTIDVKAGIELLEWIDGKEWPIKEITVHGGGDWTRQGSDGNPWMATVVYYETVKKE